LPFPGPPPPTGSYNLIQAQFGNGLRGNTEGVEIAPEWQPLKFWRLRGSYSFLHMDLGKNPNPLVLATPSMIVGSSPQHEVMMQSYLDLPKQIGVDFEFRHISALVAQNVPAYSTANLHASWRPNPHVELSVAGENLFQPSHAEFASDPTGIVYIGRTAYGKVTFNK
jgi:iron complex outermembrane receptor protein